MTTQTTTRRTRDEITRDREDALKAVELEVERKGERVTACDVAYRVEAMSGRHSFERYFEDVERRVARDLEALAKAGKVDRKVRKFYGSAPVRDGLFGGSVAVRRRRAEFATPDQAADEEARQAELRSEILARPRKLAEERAKADAKDAVAAAVDATENGVFEVKAEDSVSSIEDGTADGDVFEARESPEFDGYSAEAFVDFLEGTLIPDLEESGRDFTAADFRTACKFIRLLTAEAREERTRQVVGGCLSGSESVQWGKLWGALEVSHSDGGRFILNGGPIAAELDKKLAAIREEVSGASA